MSCTSRGEPVLSQETYFLARTQQTTTRDDQWTELECAIGLELRWWTLQELEQSDALIFPRILPRRIRSALLHAGDQLEAIPLG